MPEISTQISAFFYPVLIAVVGFFLIQFYIVVTRQLKTLNEDTKQILIKLAEGDGRFKNLEQRVDRLDDDQKDVWEEIEKIKEQVYSNKK